jgi:hypothetical protein
MTAYRTIFLAGTIVFTTLAGAAQAQNIKTPLHGLISMGAYRFVGAGGDPINTLEHLDAKPGIFGGIVVVASWKQLQPTSASDFDHSVIDQAMAQVRAYNERNPQKPLGVKLRIWGGFEAPDWAKQIGGAPIQTTHSGTPRVVGRFWLPAYRQAWANLQQHLAARYDKWPLIKEVSITQCMSYTAEPFFVPLDVVGRLRAAGFNDAAYKNCLSNAVSDYSAWKESRLVLSVNPLRTGPNQGNGDVAFTKQVMLNCRKAVGRRCVLDNHNLDTDPPNKGGVYPLYAYMKQLGPEIEFQTYVKTPKDFDGTIKMGVSYGASSIELWQDYGGFPLVPDAKLKLWASWLEKNTGVPGH